MILSSYWRQFGLVLGLAVAVSACSTIASLDPTGLLSDNSDNAPASQFPADQSTPAASDQSAGTTPDLASIPSPPATSSATQQQQAAQSLASDGAQARYSADTLRGGTEAAAPPPPADNTAPGAAARPAASAQAAMAANPLDMPPSAEPPAPAPALTAQQMAANDVPPTAEPAPVASLPAPAPTAAPTLPEGAQPAPAANAPLSTAMAPARTPAVPAGNVRTAAIAPATSATSASPVGPSQAVPGGAPVVAANTPARNAMMAQPALSDAALGFKPSEAPPLDPSVSDFVAAPIVAHYRQTASTSEMAVARAEPAVPAVPPKGETAIAETSPAVETNMAALSGAPAAIAAMNGGVPPTAVIYFPGDGTSLSAAARAQVKAAAASFKANGGQGTVRVVGHSSSRTADMPVEKHLEVIFDKSQARANAVAQELIHDGVPAARVLIDAVGDSQPVYYESMPQGEEGNRRAEIFVQS